MRGPTLAGATELLSPSNKDRPANRDGFVGECAAYLQQRVGLVVVDVVTDWHSDWHGALLKRLGWTEEIEQADLSAAAFRPVDLEATHDRTCREQRIRIAAV